jgi:hypothetical protein
MAKLVADPAMLATLASFDIALLDTSESAGPINLSPRLYVIERNGEAVLRYIRSGSALLLPGDGRRFGQPYGLGSARAIQRATRAMR